MIEIWYWTVVPRLWNLGQSWMFRPNNAASIVDTAALWLNVQHGLCITVFVTVWVVCCRKYCFQKLQLLFCFVWNLASRQGGVLSQFVMVNRGKKYQESRISPIWETKSGKPGRFNKITKTLVQIIRGHSAKQKNHTHTQRRPSAGLTLSWKVQHWLHVHAPSLICFQYWSNIITLSLSDALKSVVHVVVLNHLFRALSALASLFVHQHFNAAYIFSPLIADGGNSRPRLQ